MAAQAKALGEIQWSQPATKGDKPSPRSGHTITVVGDKAVIFGGCGVDSNNEPLISNQTFFLTLSTDPMKWSEADLMGDIPHERWRHTATLLPDEERIMVFGGLCKGKCVQTLSPSPRPNRGLTTGMCATPPSLPHALTTPLPPAGASTTSRSSTSLMVSGS